MGQFGVMHFANVSPDSTVEEFVDVLRCSPQVFKWWEEGKYEAILRVSGLHSQDLAL